MKEKCCKVARGGWWRGVDEGEGLEDRRKKAAASGVKKKPSRRTGRTKRRGVEAFDGGAVMGDDALWASGVRCWPFEPVLGVLCR